MIALKPESRTKIWSHLQRINKLMLGWIILLSIVTLIGFPVWYNNFWYNWYNKRPSSKMNLYAEYPRYLPNKKYRPISSLFY